MMIRSIKAQFTELVIKWEWDVKMYNDNKIKKKL